MGPIWGRQEPGGPHVGPWTLLSGPRFQPNSQPEVLRTMLMDIRRSWHRCNTDVVELETDDRRIWHGKHEWYIMIQHDIDHRIFLKIELRLAPELMRRYHKSPQWASYRCLLWVHWIQLIQRYRDCTVICWSVYYKHGCIVRGANNGYLSGIRCLPSTCAYAITCHKYFTNSTCVSWKCYTHTENETY